MPQIFDNIKKHLCEALQNTLDVSYRSDFCVGYFNLRGWKQVAEYIDKWSGLDDNRCRLLVGMQKLPEDAIHDLFSTTEHESIDNKKAIELKKKLAQDFKDQLTIGIPTEQDEIGLRKLARQLKTKKVVVKLFLAHPLHAKLYLLYRNDKINPIIGYLGSSNLTFAGLAKQGELNIDVLDSDATEKLVKWFEDRWIDRWCIDISEELAEIIDSSWASEELVPPYHIYLKIAFHLSREARTGINEFKIPREFKDVLLEFQEQAVLVAAQHLNKRGGVLIGDVVGLGKTITACALAKIFEEDFFLETLIICPKNLKNMWEDYVHKYRLHAKVMSISIVQNELPDLRRYRLVIIDESHNLRNRFGKRFRFIQEYIQQNESKVILLTATPYNKAFLDLSSQLRLFILEDSDLGIGPENYINSIGGRVEFQARHQVGIRTIAAFENSDFADDWRELMRLFLVRRTRSFIKQNYAATDYEKNRKYLTFHDGRRSYFPDRIAKKVEYDFNPNDPEDQYAKLYTEQVVNIINGLNLPRYGLGNYIDEKSKLNPTRDEVIIIDNLSRAGKRLKGFSRTNLFKRLESSGYSFLLSIGRHILRNYLFAYAIENNLEIPIGQQETTILDYYVVDTENDEKEEENLILLDEEKYKDKAAEFYSVLKTKFHNRYDWIRTGLFTASLQKDLLRDAQQLLTILKIGKDWNAEHDRQLNALHKLCVSQHKNEKILVFTQFADTANYLTKHLKGRGIQQLECVTGDSDDPTKLAWKFSPVSNEKAQYKDSSDELRIIISTDVLSEGQNLQDAHIVVNYDLPWAIIRLIQRAGRVDRIGQSSDFIVCYSFLPEDGIEQIIRLRKRLTQRIQENAEVVGSDEIFFDGDMINIADLYNEKAGILEDDEDDEVDLASQAFEIWNQAIDADPSLKKTIPDMPNVVYSTKGLDEQTGDAPGVVVYARTGEDNDVLSWVNVKGELITQSQLAILRAIKCTPECQALPKLKDHHQLVAQGLEYVKDIERQIGGQLGKKTSARFRCYMKLTRFYEENANTLFVNEALKRAIDDIYKYPLKEYARDVINRQLKAGVNDEGLADLVIALREEDRLSITIDDEKSYKEPKIICSLGFKAKE